MIQSPLNYTGGKYRLLPQILPLFPSKIKCFVDLFCGGCNVGINVSAEKYIYNDCCEPLIELYSVMQGMESVAFIGKVNEIIKQYELSDVKLYGYDYYKCNSSDGLGKYNKDKYTKLKVDFNKLDTKNEDYYIMLYVLIVFAFNNQIRFNQSGEFNLPIGKRDFNQKMYDKVSAFINTMHDQNASFLSKDFRKIHIANLTNKDFVYADPPYLITCAEYNERGGWTEKDETDLLALLDDLTNRRVKFALSNVIESKGKENTILKQWIESRPNYKMIELNYSYNNSSYQRQNKEKKTREVLVINY